MRGRAKRIIAASVAVTCSAMAVASQSEASVYCVPNNSIDPSCEIANASLQPALTAASNSAGVADTVRIGAGNYPVSNSGYTNAGDDVQIIGSGIGATNLQLNNTTGVSTGFIFSAPATSAISNLSLVIGAPMDSNADRGFQLFGGGTLRGVSVTGPNATNAIGVVMNDASVLDDSRVDLEPSNPSSNIGVRVEGGTPLVTDSVLIADVGLTSISLGSPEGSLVNRSSIVAKTGVSSGGGDPIEVRNTVIDLLDLDGAAGLLAENANEGISPLVLTGDHLTIVGGGTGSAGVRAVGSSNGGLPDPFGGVPEDANDDGETATVTLSNSLISGPETAIFAGADRGEVATITTSYSNYAGPAIEDDDLDDNPVGTGNATLVQTNRTTFADPGFLDPGDGDYRLLGSSPLIDIADPSNPAAGETDRDGNPRAVGSPAGCNNVPPAGPVRRDIGAFEFTSYPVASCPGGSIPIPVATPAPTKPKKCAKKKAKKRVGSIAAKSKCKRKKRKKAAK